MWGVSGGGGRTLSDKARKEELTLPEAIETSQEDIKKKRAITKLKEGGA